MDNPFYTRLLYVFTFIFYGLIILVISFSISNHYQVKQTKSKMIETQKQSFNTKSTHLKNTIDDFSNKINLIKTSEIFNKYLNNLNKNKDIKDLFSVIINQSKSISQLRYIDENGNERIRFDRDKIANDSYEVSSEKLQNKKSRYYFKEIKALEENKIWYSKLDLNVEHGKIQKPIVPTLRLGIPIYDNKEFKGLIIMNIFFKDIISEFVTSPYFYITIYDKDGEFIHHKHEDKNGVLVDYSWSRYLKKDVNLDIHKYDLKNLLSNKDIKDYIFNIDIKKIIPTADDLLIYYEPKLVKLKEFEKDEKNYILTVSIIVLLLSIPLAFIISIIPNLLNDELFKTKKQLEHEMNVVDENVYLYITDIEGRILDVSQAYLNLIGCEKDDLVGKKHNVLSHPNTKIEQYKDLWDTILAKNVYKGEIRNLKKNGTPFDIKLLIKPNLDDDGEIKTFTAYVEDITYQKKVERTSVTDELTKLYNRREFNKVFERYISHSKRYEHSFSMVVLDIDYFKQYNDTYGHLKGDVALRYVACELIESCLRTTDLSFRVGGEEFCVLYSSNNYEEAELFAYKIKEKIEDLKIEHKNSKVSDYLTVSVGLFYAEDLGELTSDEIYQSCDEQLYKAKANGRNKICSISI